MKHMEDENLMARYQKGDEEAFKLLYEKFSPVVYGYLRKKLPPSEVEDVYQNVWRRLHEKRDHYSDQPFAPWFFAVIKNLMVDQYRSLGKMNLLREKLTESGGNKFVPVDIPELLAQLPLDSQALVKRYYLDGESYADIEAQTGMSQITLRKRLSRAMAQLRKISRD